MTDIIKQRLIGGLLLLSVMVGIVFFLISNTNKRADSDSDVVEQVELKSVIAPIEQELAELDQEVLLEPAPLKNQATSDIDDKNNSTTDNNSTQSWVIQLASFSKQENAQALHEKASKLGFKSRVEPFTQKNKTNYRVRIGPEHDKKQVNEIVAKLTTQLSIKPQILISQP